MAEFAKSMAFLDVLEGIDHERINKANRFGHVDHPNDYGRETLGGRSRYWKLIRGKLPLDAALWKAVDRAKLDPTFPANLHDRDDIQLMIEDCYRFDEWIGIKGDYIQDQEVADEVFEFAVHKRADFSVGFLQYVMNKLNYGGRLFPNMREVKREDWKMGDGDFGIKTHDRLQILLDRGDGETLLSMFNARQGSYYLERVESDESQEINIRGFFRRVKLRKAAPAAAQTKEE